MTKLRQLIILVFICFYLTTMFSGAYAAPVQAIIDQNDQTIADCTNAIANNPNDSIAYCRRGGAYVQKKKNDLALQDLNKAIEINPKYAYAFVLRGLLYWQTGEDDMAFADFDKAIQYDQYSVIGYWGRAEMYSKKKEYDLAIADCEKAIAISPSALSVPYFIEATAYEKQQKYQEAITTYRRLIVNISNDKAAVEKAKVCIQALGGTV